jgi:hypothetical protein
MIPQIWEFFRPRNISVSFRDLPGHPVDRSLFESIAFGRISDSGSYPCSPAELLQAAAVHYQGRFRNLRSAQWLNACLEVLPSLAPDPADRLALNSNESSEFQVKSSEVIAVGIGLSLCKRLFRVRYQDINTIERSGKRCDFEFIRNNHGYVIETRGRKDSVQIKYAIEDVFEKKAHHRGARYGFVCHLPRDGQPCSATVVDPPLPPRRIAPWQRASLILKYYSRAARLAGFWRLSDMLNERARRISRAQSAQGFDRVELDYGNIEKLGRPMTVRAANATAHFFVSPSDQPEGLFRFRDFSFVFGLDATLMRLLQFQDFDALLDYRLQSPPDLQEPIHFNEDGTILAATPAAALSSLLRQ